MIHITINQEGRVLCNLSTHLHTKKTKRVYHISSPPLNTHNKSGISKYRKREREKILFFSFQSRCYSNQNVKGSMCGGTHPFICVYSQKSRISQIFFSRCVFSWRKKRKKKKKLKENQGSYIRCLVFFLLGELLD